MSGPDDHPHPQKLAEYEAGVLREEDAAPLQQHLESCRACREALINRRRLDPATEELRSAVAFHDSTMAADSLATAAPPMPPAGEAASIAWPIPDYDRVQMCGEGAYGSVWAVRDRVGVYRALKLIRVGKLSASGGDRSALRERTALETYCRTISHHPYLIDVFHVGLVDDQLYYTMELADNDETKQPVTTEFPPTYRPLTLATVMRRRRVRPDTAVEIARRLLRGLIHLHEAGLVHRDIKPANIVIVKHTPKLADVGMVTGGPKPGGKRSIIGTPKYMPPDMMMDQSADVFALGRVLHEMIAGMDKDEFPYLPDRCFDYSTVWSMQRLQDVILRACAVTKAQRYSSAANMLEDIEACAISPLETLFAEVDEPSSRAPDGSRPQRRERSRAAAPEGRETARPRRPIEKEILLAALRVIPWLLGFAALLIVLSWFR